MWVNMYFLRCKISKTSHSSSSNISQTWLILQETSRPKARSLGMKPKVCCRPFATITGSLYEIYIFYLSSSVLRFLSRSRFIWLERN